MKRFFAIIWFGFKPKLFNFYTLFLFIAIVVFLAMDSFFRSQSPSGVVLPLSLVATAMILSLGLGVIVLCIKLKKWYRKKAYWYDIKQEREENKRRWEADGER